MRSSDSLQKIVDFLAKDVEAHGGCASEIVETHASLMDITVSCSPWGLIIIKKPVSHFEAVMNVKIEILNEKAQD